MKKRLIPIFSLLLLLYITPAFAQEKEKDKDKKEKYEFSKERSISKTYPAAGNKLSIENSFGDIKFITTTGNEIKVDIHIEVSSNQQDVAQRTFDGITVTDKQQGNEVSFVTKHSKDGASCKNCKINMRVDYEVRLPASVALDIENSFGDINMPDHSAAVSVSSKFGNLTAGSLPNLKKINVEFGKADVKNISNIDANFKFSKIQIASLSGKNDIKMEFCDNSKIGLDNNLSSLDLHESYSNVNLKPESNLSASYKIATSFGSVVDRSNAGIKRTDTPDEYGPDSNRTYEGKSGSGAAKIDIKSSFGKIIVGEPTADDLKKNEGNNNKNKQKSKRVVI